MDVTKTRIELVNKAGAMLNVSSSSSALAAEDFDTIEDYVDPTALRLAAENIVDVTGDLEADEIPSEYFLPLAAILADAAKAEFGRAGDQGLMAEAQVAEKLLLRLTASQATSETLQSDYF